MMQSRTHTCGQLRIENAGERVTLVGWMENVRVVGNNFPLSSCVISTARRRSSSRRKRS